MDGGQSTSPRPGVGRSEFLVGRRASALPSLSLFWEKCWRWGRQGRPVLPLGQHSHPGRLLQPREDWSLSRLPQSVKLQVPRCCVGCGLTWQWQSGERPQGLTLARHCDARDAYLLPVFFLSTSSLVFPLIFGPAPED